MPTPDLASDLASNIERWFRRHQRPLPWRSTYNPYHVWVSEVMAQQTRMEVVVGYFERFIERFPTIGALANATDDEVTAAWSGLGYYRRARMLRDGAIDVCSRFDGRLPRTVDKLLTIAGIGPYTAGAIASIAFDERAPIVDGNVARVVSRLFGVDAPAGSRDAWMHATELVDAAKSPRMLNQGLMEIGALLCAPRNPSCLLCPLAASCSQRAELPQPKAKAATRELHIPLYLVTDRTGRVLMRRESGQLMTAMFHLPHGNAALFDDKPIAVQNAEPLGTFRHTVTNRRITFELFRARAKRAAGYEWIDPAALATVPHPSYVRKALELASVYPERSSGSGGL